MTHPYAFDATTDPSTWSEQLLVPSCIELVLDPRSDLEAQEHGVRTIRLLLQARRTLVLNSPSLLRRCAYYLHHGDRWPHVQIEALGVLAAMGDHRVFTTADGLVSGLIRLILSSRHDEVKRYAIQTIGDRSRSVSDRDEMARSGIFTALQLQWDTTPEPATTTTQEKHKLLRRRVAETLRSLCKAKPRTGLSSPLKPFFAVLSRWLLDRREHDDVAVADILWTFSFVLEEDKHSENVLFLDLVVPILPRVVDFLASNDHLVVGGAIRIVGELAAADESTTALVATPLVLAAIMPLLSHRLLSIRKEASWTCSNIAAGSPQHVDAMLATEGLFPAIIRNVGAVERDVKRDAVWTISNAVSCGRREVVQQLVDLNVLVALGGALSGAIDKRVVLVALEAVESILHAGESTDDNNVYASAWRNSGGVAKLEGLGQHPSNDVYQLATRILGIYTLNVMLVMCKRATSVPSPRPLHQEGEREDTHE